MKIAIFFAAAACMATASAQANFTGDWSGNGQIAYYDGRTESCTARFDLTHNADVFYARGGRLDCGELHATWETEAVAIRDGELWSGASRVGMISEDYFTAAFPTSQGDNVYEGRITAEGGMRMRLSRRIGGQDVVVVNLDLAR